ncbi:hypothetical protein WR25_14567 [Diploscapter pachys]|uniref:Major facilitator superfamily (MFS) profile domain-containing protein n=1 Tax=Diploscapter pachys TaxID=2018661 RepID=A0A2A2L4X0_9BILA|nr:hypothetical protein WR25_14567 [Diploscapter pachys]
MAGKHMPSLRMIVVALITSLGGSFHFGFQIVLTNPAEDAFLNFLNMTLGSHYKNGLSESTLENIWSFVVAVVFLGAVFGSLMIRPLADKIGRKRGLYVSIGGQMISGGLSMTAKFIPSFILYVISRITMGFFVSISLYLSALYLSESSPKECRGAIGMITGVCVQLGTVFGSIVAMPELLGTVKLWDMIYLVEICIMAVFYVMLPFLPESPGFLIQKGKLAEATQAIQYFQKCSEDKANIIMTEIQDEQEKATRKYTVWDCLKKRSLRKNVFIGLVVIFAMSFSGIAVINAFAFQILCSTGLTVLEASFANVGIALVSVLASGLASVIVDRFGRRPLLLISFVAILICNFFVFGLMYTFDMYQYRVLGYLLILVICLFIISFAIGPGPLCFFINAELVGQAARSASQSCASFMQMFCRFLLVTSFMPMKNQLGESWSYLILFIVPVFVSIIYLYFNLPETKNKNAAEVEEAMAKLPSIYAIFKCEKTEETSSIDEKSTDFDNSI